jgi:hypothetical protein
MTVAVRQGSFIDRSPTRGSAVNVCQVSGLVGAQHLSRWVLASGYQSVMGPYAGSSPVTVSELGAWGPCARWLRGLTPPLVPSCM